MIISRTTILSLIYIISISPYFISRYGTFYTSRPYFYLILFFIVLYDLFKNFKLYKKNISLPVSTIIPILLILIIEFISVFYSYNKYISIQLFITNLFIVSTLLIYISQMDRSEISHFFLNIVFINAFLYLVSILLLICDYKLATVTRFGFYTFSGIFYFKQIGILSLITIFSIDIAKNNISSQNSRLDYFFNIMYVTSILFIILSFSRGAFLSLLIYWGILIAKMRVPRKYLSYYIPLLTILLLLYIFHPLNNIIKYTVTDRQYFLNYAIHIYKNYLFKGNGYGCGKFLTLLPEASRYMRLDLMGKQFHNSYLEIYFDTGLIGLLAFLWMIFALFKRAIHYNMRLLISIIIPILFLNILTSSLAYPSSLSYYFSYILIIYGLIKDEDFSKTEYSPDT